jgi:hypothetical protein
MTRTVKTVLAALSLGGLCFLLGAAGLPQDAEPAQKTFFQESTWNFAVLQYRNSDGVVEVPAKNITRIWLVAMGHGELRLEILFENRDFSSVHVRDFSIIRRSNSLNAVDVPIVRTTLEGMAFPASFK